MLCSCFAQEPAQWSQHGEQKQYRATCQQCQNPGEGTHIHVVEQVQPQGMKKQRTKQRNTSQQPNVQGNFTPQYRTTIQRAISVNKHKYPYQIRKIKVLQHQP